MKLNFCLPHETIYKDKDVDQVKKAVLLFVFNLYLLSLMRYKKTSLSAQERAAFVEKACCDPHPPTANPIHAVVFTVRQTHLRSSASTTARGQSGIGKTEKTSSGSSSFCHTLCGGDWCEDVCMQVVHHTAADDAPHRRTPGFCFSRCPACRFRSPLLPVPRPPSRFLSADVD